MNAHDRLARKESRSILMLFGSQKIVDSMSSSLYAPMRDANSLVLLRDVHLAGAAREIDFG